MFFLSEILKRIEALSPQKQLLLEKYLREREASGLENILKTNLFAQIKPIEKKDYYAVSSAQKRMFVLNNIEGTGTAYNMPAAFEVKGPLDKYRFESAFKELIKRHEAFRTSFMLENNMELVQIIHEEIAFEVNYKEIDGNKIDEIITNFIKPFDLSKPPLLRVELLKLNDMMHIILLDMHHIISDGISQGILVNEFTKLYRGETLPEITIQYKDFSEWQNNFLKSEMMKRHENYWLNKFKGEIPVLSMITDYPRPNLQNFEGDSVRVLINKVIKDGINKLVEQTESTLCMVLIAILNILLSKYSGQEDIIIGLPIAGRKHADLENVIGLFVNTLAMRNYPNGNKTFLEFMYEVKSDSIKAYENQDYQFECLIDKLGVQRDISRNPIFNILFVMLNTEFSITQVKDLEFKPYLFQNKVSKFDIVINANEQEDLIYLDLIYCSKIFKRETIESLGRHFVKILEEAISCPEIKLSDIEMLDFQEKKKLLQINNTKADYPKEKTIKQLFEGQAAKTPENIALVYQGSEISYRELNEKSNQLARVLIEKGADSGTIVGIMVEQSIDMVLAILAVIKSGAAYLPIDFTLPQDRIDYMLLDNKTKILICSEQTLQDLKFEGTILKVEHALIGYKDKSDLPNANCSRDLLYVIYTSGTTGVPKGVLIENISLVNYISWFINKTNVSSKDRTILLSSFCFDLGYTNLFSSILSGGQLHILSKDEYRDPGKILNYISNFAITYIKCTPSMFGLIVNSKEFLNQSYCNTLQWILLGGEQINLVDVEVYHNLYHNTQILNHYGPTETTVGAITHVIDFSRIKDYKSTPTIGKPISNTKIYILDKYLKPVIQGAIGEIYISGDGLARGYLNQPQLTKEKFIDNVLIPGERMYRTGDLARCSNSEEVEFIGRIDQQIKIRGYRIEAAEIEYQILRSSLVKETFVTAKTDCNGNKYICAYIITMNDNISVQELREFLVKRLPDYMIPQYFIKVDKISLTPNGKVDIKALPECEDSIETGVLYSEPRNETEVLLAKVWEKILKVDRVGINDNFFFLGGDSIKAVQVKASLDKLKLDLKDLFMYPTISELSKFVYRYEKEIKQEIVEGEVQLSPIQKMFFDSNFEDMHHWNQAVMLFKKERFDEDILVRIFTKILEHHDALRMVYCFKGNKVLQHNRGIEGQLFDFEIIDLDTDDYATVIETEANRIQGNIDLENGPLMKICLFKTDKGHHLLIVIHHLVIDGISWRILIEDFSTLYRQILTGEELSLPLKTASFMEWTNKLSEYANSDTLLKEFDYWNGVIKTPLYQLTKDTKTNEQNRIMDSDLVVVTLTEEDSGRLLRHTNQVFNTEINDILLTALGLTIKNWQGSDYVLIDLEGHGREEIIRDINISRTVGWFTSIYPVVLDMSKSASLFHQIQAVKETLRSIPNKGIGYQILRYLASNNIEQLKGINTEIRFNYLGQMDDLKTEVFGISDMSVGESLSLRSKRRYLLDIVCTVVEGEFKFKFDYNKNMFGSETIEKIALDYKEFLLKIINYIDCPTRTTIENGIKIIDNIQPFNEVFYIDCFYNAFFPILQYLGASNLAFLSNDIFLYKYEQKHNNGHLDAKFISGLDVEKILFEDYGVKTVVKVKTEDVLSDIKIAIQNGRPVIISVDCFYEPIRLDMYNQEHWSHALLIYGYNEEEQIFYILEHENVNSLNYRPTKISYTDMVNSYAGYITNLQKGDKTPSYFEFYVNQSHDKSELQALDKKNYIERHKFNLEKNRAIISNSLDFLRMYTTYYKSIAKDDKYLAANIDALIRQFNNVIKAKRAEIYKLTKIYGADWELNLLQKRILANWNYLKVVIEKFKYSNVYRVQVFETSIEKLQDIYLMEKEYYGRFFGDGFDD